MQHAGQPDACLRTRGLPELTDGRTQSLYPIDDAELKGRLFVEDPNNIEYGNGRIQGHSDHLIYMDNNIKPPTMPYAKEVDFYLGWADDCHFFVQVARPKSSNVILTSSVGSPPAHDHNIFNNLFRTMHCLSVCTVECVTQFSL